MVKQTGYLLNKVRASFLQNEQSRTGNFAEFDCSYIHFENVYIMTKDNVKIGCWVIGPKQRDEDTMCIIVLHGNECNRKEFTEKYNIKQLAEVNYILLIPDYRSFGDSEGEYTIQTVNYDIDAVYNYCIANFDQNPHFVGHSLGCAVVLEYLKYRKHASKMILLSPFATTIDMLDTCVSWQMFSTFFVNARDEILTHFNYNNIANIQYADAQNVLIFHGTADRIVPYEHGKQLADTIDCLFVTLEGHDHDTMFYQGNTFYRIDWYIRDYKK